MSGLFRSVKRLLIVLMAAVMVLGVAQPLALARPTATDADTPMTQEAFAKKKQERREWQRKASASREVENDVDSVEDVVDDRLNLDQIVEENQIIEGIQELLDDDK